MLAARNPLVIFAFFEGLTVNGLVLLIVFVGDFSPVVILFLSEKFLFNLAFNLEERVVLVEGRLLEFLVFVIGVHSNY